MNPSPFELWQQAGEDGDRYCELMREHGYLIPLGPGEKGEPLLCGWPHNRRSNVPTWPVACATAHRRLPPDQADWVRAELPRVVAKLRDEHGTGTAVSGMALGGDMWWAQAALHAGLALHAHVPFPQQPDRWPAEHQREWRRLLDRATRVVTCGDRYEVRLLHARNDGMLAAADVVVAIWCGRREGGTFSAVGKAYRRGLPVIHVDPVRRTVTMPSRGRLAALLSTQPSPTG